MAQETPKSPNSSAGNAKDLLGDDGNPLEVSPEPDTDPSDGDRLKQVADRVNQSAKKQKSDPDQPNKIGIQIDLDR